MNIIFTYIQLLSYKHIFIPVNSNLGCGLYTGAAYTPISKTFLLISGGCDLYTGAAYTPEITVVVLMGMHFDFIY